MPESNTCACASPCFLAGAYANSLRRILPSARRSAIHSYIRLTHHFLGLGRGGCMCALGYTNLNILMRVVWRSLDTAESINARLFCSCDQMGAIFQDLMNFFWFVDRSGCGMDTGMCGGDLTWFPTGSIGSFRDTSSPASRKAGSMQCRTRRTKTCGLLSEVGLCMHVCVLCKARFAVFILFRNFPPTTTPNVCSYQEYWFW